MYKDSINNLTKLIKSYNEDIKRFREMGKKELVKSNIAFRNKLMKIKYNYNQELKYKKRVAKERYDMVKNQIDNIPDNEILNIEDDINEKYNNEFMNEESEKILQYKKEAMKRRIYESYINIPYNVKNETLRDTVTRNPKFKAFLLDNFNNQFNEKGNISFSIYIERTNKYNVYDKLQNEIENIRVNKKGKLQPTKEQYLSMVEKYKPTKENFYKNDFKNKYYISSGVKNVINKNEIFGLFMESILDIDNKIHSYNSNSESDNFITKIGLKVYEYKPLAGNMYFEIPKFISLKKATINIKNEDEYCFLYCVLLGLYGDEIKDHPERVSHYKILMNKINFKGFDFPMKIDDIPKFEKLNNVNINVIRYVEKFSTLNSWCEFMPLYKSKIYNDNYKTINLLYCEKNENGKILEHYVYIRDLSRLLRSSVTKHENKVYFCMNCFYNNINEKLVKEHETNCFNNYDTVKTMMPTKKDKVLKFKNHNNKNIIPVKVFCDFESVLIDINEEKSKTLLYQEHKLSAYMLYVSFSDKPELNKIYKCIGDKSINKFYEDIIEIKNYIKSIYDMPFIPTEENKNIFKNKEICDQCHELIKKVKSKGKEAKGDAKKLKKQDLTNQKFYNYNYVTKEFKNIICGNCETKAYFSKKNINFIYHNLKGYDGHIILKNVDLLFNKSNDYILEGIPLTKEKLLSFTLKNTVDGFNLKFLDSYAFLSCGLNELANNLKKEEKINTYRYFKNLYSDDVINELLKKGVYPYDFMNDFNKFNMIDIPKKENFYSKMNDKNISDEEYKRAVNIWNITNCKNMGDYTMIYLICDVLLLADVCENFVKKAIDFYKLEPFYYYSLPGLAIDSALLMSNKKIELLSDQQMYNFFERNIRGGLSYTAKRYAKANNKYMENYDKNIDSSYLLYIDCNGLYSAGQSYKLPVGNFKYESVEDWNLNKILNYDFFNENKGYTFEVNIEIPESTQDFTYDYPLFPENKKIEDSQLSKYQNDLLYAYKMQEIKINNSDLTTEEIDEKIKDMKSLRLKTNKLVIDMSDKKNYVIHGGLLKLYLQLGAKLKSINKIISYDQEAWLKTFIDFNTKQRALTKSDFEKDLYKLMNNATYGKQLENVRGRKNYKFYNNITYDKFIKKVSRNLLVDSTIINESLILAEMKKEKCQLNKPIFSGASILDISKYIMYDFFYNKLIKQYKRENIQLIYTDTDSFIVEIKTDDLYADILKNKELYDLSEMEHLYFIDENKKPVYNENKKVFGKFKDELKGKVMTEIVCLKSKMYAYKSEQKYDLRAKGIKKDYAKTNIKFEDYYNILFGKNYRTDTIKSIRSYNHTINTIEQTKISLSAFDDKRYYLNAYESLPFNHYKLKN